MLQTVLSLVEAEQGVSIVHACARNLRSNGVRFYRLQPDDVRVELVAAWETANHCTHGGGVGSGLHSRILFRDRKRQNRRNRARTRYAARLNLYSRRKQPVANRSLRSSEKHVLRTGRSGLVRRRSTSKIKRFEWILTKKESSHERAY